MAGHVASLPGFIIRVSSAPEIDVASPDTRPSKVEKEDDLVELHGKLGTQACEALAKLGDDQFTQPWSLKQGDKVRMCFNHIIHHRGQLTMYLRAINVPVPGLYGPSADENPFNPGS
jgi:uncharacterized damage-inducible protein DinB